MEIGGEEFADVHVAFRKNTWMSSCRNPERLFERNVLTLAVEG
jgi:hypothetical protein